MLEWLLGAGIGPAAAALPVNWAAAALAGAAQRWFRRLRRTDDLSRLVRAATGTSVDLTHDEFGAVRRLLEDRRTWSVAGRGTVEDLASRISSCLPPRDGRTTEDSKAAARTIARGLLEFAVADLDPKFFQQVLLTRLNRMETGQASALDKALLDLHADLIARFDSVMEQLKGVLDRLPPGPAQRGEIAVYLRVLIDWLSTDPWPRDRRFGAAALAPATIERKLRITATGITDEQRRDVDDRVEQCRRLIILGGPGSGKTWLAKRAARRCAEEALTALAAGETLDEVEIPLYTTCSRLFTADGDIREAVVSSALGQLADLGGSRISEALRVFFTERNTPTLLVIDSLDEAHGSDERLRQAGTLPWRIVLTSRPNSWNYQLAIDERNDSDQVGELRPLEYPDDVEPFITRWFAQRPELGRNLVSQIARRPGLQQAATVPLILTLYCIIGGAQPLPDFRRDLYTRSLNRILTGRWRGGADRGPDPDACLQVLRAWAWTAAASHPVSGIGTWGDEFPTRRSGLDQADDDAIDHVAAPTGLADVDAGTTLRRFIHRSIREHLVAEHVASLAMDEAAEKLLPHLWYDPDWEYVTPAALAMHPQHDQLLRDLICRAAGSDQIPKDLSVVDAGWEVRRLLARLATESSEADWSPDIAAMIGHARLQLAQSTHTDELEGTVYWQTSSRQAREALLGQLADTTHSSERAFVDRLAALLARGLVQLAPTAEEMRQAREALLQLLSKPTYLFGTSADLVRAVAQLAPTAEDKRQAREALFRLLADPKRGASSGSFELVDALVGGVVQLASTAEEMRQAREALLGLLSDKADYLARKVAAGVVQLNPTTEDQQKARRTLLRLLARDTEGRRAGLADALAQLDPTAEDQRQARQALLSLLAGQSDRAAAARLVAGLTQLAPTAEDQRQACQALLNLLADPTGPADLTWWLVITVLKLDPTAEDKRQARQVLLAQLADPIGRRPDSGLVPGLIELDPTAEDQRQARQVLLRLLARENKGRAAADLADAMVRLDPTAEDQRQARQALLSLLARKTKRRVAADLADALAQLDPTAEDQRQARQALLSLLARKTDSDKASQLAASLVRLDPTADEKSQARQAVLRAPRSLRYSGSGKFGHILAELALTAEDTLRAREALHEQLSRQTDPIMANDLMIDLAQLQPTVDDLAAWRAWAAPPAAELLAAARRNSALTAWLAALPSLFELSAQLPGFAILSSASPAEAVHEQG